MLTACCVLAAGAGPGWTASSSSSTVGATVLSATSLSTTGCPTRTTNITGFGALPTGTSYITTAPCTIAFGSSNDVAALRVAQRDGSGVALHEEFSTTRLDASFGTAGMTTYNAGGTEAFEDAVVDTQGRIVVVGTKGSDAVVARYLANGTLDPAFGAVAISAGASSDRLYDVALAPDGDIVAAGNYGTVDTLVVRVQDTGVMEGTFGTAGIKVIDVQGAAAADVANGVAVASDGRIAVVGQVSNATTDAYTLLLDGTGAPINAFSGDGIVQYTLGTTYEYGVDAAFQSTGRLVVTGVTEQTNDNIYVGAYLADGTLDPSFNGGSFRVVNNSADDLARSVQVRGDDRVVVVGNDEFDGLILQLTSAGAMDTAFSGDGIAWFDTGGASGQTDSWFGLALLEDNRTLVTGSVSGNILIGRFTSSGNLDASRLAAPTGWGLVDLGTSDVGRAVVVPHDGKAILVGARGTDGVLAQLQATPVPDVVPGSRISTTARSPTSGHAASRAAPGSALADGPRPVSAGARWRRTRRGTPSRRPPQPVERSSAATPRARTRASTCASDSA